MQSVRSVPGSATGEIMEVVVKMPAAHSRAVNSLLADIAHAVAGVDVLAGDARRAACALITQIRTNYGEGCVEVVAVVPVGKEPAQVEGELRAHLHENLLQLARTNLALIAPGSVSRRGL